MTERLSEIVESPEPERLATGFQFTEGPLWHPDGYLLFVDIRTSRIFSLTPGAEPEVIREDSGESNGMTFDADGRLVVCEMINRRVTRHEDDGSYTTLADGWNGQRLNRPNDVILKSDGSLYFTNPGRERLDPAEVDMQFNSVHRIRPDGSVDMVVPGFQYPNGLAFSPDESVLYVANTRPGQYILAFDLDADGEARARQTLRRHAVRVRHQRRAGRHEGRCRGPCVLHGAGRVLGVRAVRGADRRHPSAGVSRQLRLGRAGQPNHVLHREHVRLQPAHDDTGRLTRPPLRTNRSHPTLSF